MDPTAASGFGLFNAALACPGFLRLALAANRDDEVRSPHRPQVQAASIPLRGLVGRPPRLEPDTERFGALAFTTRFLGGVRGSDTRSRDRNPMRHGEIASPSARQTLEDRRGKTTAVSPRSRVI